MWKIKVDIHFTTRDIFNEACPLIRFDALRWNDPKLRLNSLRYSYHEVVHGERCTRPDAGYTVRESEPFVLGSCLQEEHICIRCSDSSGGLHEQPLLLPEARHPEEVHWNIYSSVDLRFSTSSDRLLASTSYAEGGGRRSQETTRYRNSYRRWLRDRCTFSLWWMRSKLQSTSIYCLRTRDVKNYITIISTEVNVCRMTSSSFSNASKLKGFYKETWSSFWPTAAHGSRRWGRL